MKLFKMLTETIAYCAMHDHENDDYEVDENGTDLMISCSGHYTISELLYKVELLTEANQLRNAILAEKLRAVHQSELRLETQKPYCE